MIKYNSLILNDILHKLRVVTEFINITDRKLLLIKE